MRSTFKVLFYLKKNKHKIQPVVPVMGRITVNGTIAQFSAKINVPPHLWEVKGGRAKGKSTEADRINRHLDNIRTQIGKHYQSICDHDDYISANKVKNAYLGFGRKYKLLLELCDDFCKDYKTRVDVDRTIHSLRRYHMARHTFATTVTLMNGVPLETVSKMLGHKYTTTTQIYAKVTNQMIGNAINQIEDKIGDRFQFPTLTEESDG